MATLAEISNNNLTQDAVQSVSGLRVSGPSTGTPAIWQGTNWPGNPSDRFYAIIPTSNAQRLQLDAVFGANASDGDKLAPDSFITVQLTTTRTINYNGRPFGGGPIFSGTVTPRTFNYGAEGGLTAADGRPVYLGKFGGNIYIGVNDRSDIALNDTFSFRLLNYGSSQQYRVIADPPNLYINAGCTFLTALDTSQGTNTILTVDPNDNNKIIATEGPQAGDDTHVISARLFFVGSGTNRRLRLRLQTNSNPATVITDDQSINISDIVDATSAEDFEIPNPLQVETTPNVDNIQFSNDFSVTPQGTQVNVQIAPNVIPTVIPVEVFGDISGSPETEEEVTDDLTRLTFDATDFLLDETSTGQVIVHSKGGGRGTVGINTASAVDGGGTQEEVAPSPTELFFGPGFSLSDDGEAIPDEVYIDLESNVPRIFEHDQTLIGPSTQWVISHGLDSIRPVVTVYDTGNNVILPMDIFASIVGSTNTIEISFPIALEGYATLVG